MNQLKDILEEVKNCNSCSLMSDNAKLDIPYIPIFPKPKAKFIFIGRDPSPRTATIVGVRGGKSVFINEIFSIVDDAKISEDEIFITDMCKCHWRTSVGTPWKGTENRNTDLPNNIAKTCIDTWLKKEIEELQPKIIFSFGEELYQQLLPYIIEPTDKPVKLSASKDKKKFDAENYFIQKGAFKIKLGSVVTNYVPMRHAGNSTKLPRDKKEDNRWIAYQQSRRMAIEMLREML